MSKDKMKRLGFFLLMLGVVSLERVSAQEEADTAALAEMLAEDTVAIEDSILYDIEDAQNQLDSMLSVWYNSHTQLMSATNDLVPDTLVLADSIVSGITDDVYVQRLQALQSPIPMTYNNQVKKFIELYIVKRREQVERMLGLSRYYFPLFEEMLDANDMPLELKYLPIIESALNPRALSRVGASGLWQFMYYTGKRYGCEVTSYVDERRDPYKASLAAAKFLKDLYAIYDDWHLAIAAYNCGPGNVNRAIARSGGQRNFWKIYYHLPRETRGYVPAFIAAAYAMNYAGEHQIRATPSILPPVADTVMVVKPLNLAQVSNVLHLSLDVIRELNPQYKHDIIPAMEGGKSYALRLPIEMTFAFAQQEDSVYAYNREKYFPNNKIVPVSEATFGGAVPANSVHFIYRVKDGDVPGGIANKFGVRLADLKYWNGLRRNIIRVGQKLHIYVPKSKADRYDGMATRVK
ncbi:MAG: transglycosylase SLT domain-containing protein [Bacteroidia bacterium]|nr:transglycosylase SLT domain-containing protein [Bacteroidia bacterium]